MSLGFLTESALLPSKAKAIKVGSKSILDLKAVVFQKEQERKERRLRLEAAVADANDTDRARDDMGSSVYARLKAGKKKRQLDRHVDKNRGVEKRSRRDEDEKELDVNDDDDIEALQKKSKEMLERKSKLYEQMMQGKLDRATAATVKECLVDFSEKRRVAGGESMTSESTDELVDITDEFGRTRRVLKGSVEYIEYAQSRGKPEMLFYEDTQHTTSATTDRREPSTGSFVVSQWEKTLNATDKMHLQHVHESTEQAKLLSVPTDKQRRKQLRLERIKQQQSQLSAPTPRVEDGRVDLAAEAKATAFLNEFM